jgi:hypothetical protein
MMKKLLVLAAAAVFVLGMSAPSWAVADFDIGASVRLDTGWQFSDHGDINEVIFGTGAEDSQTQFYLSDPGNQRINFKATVGDVMGFVEFGFGGGVSLRHSYASWDMGGGSSLLFGHTWSIMSFGFTDQRQMGDLANIGFGTLYFGRNPQLRYTYASDVYTVKVAIENNDKTTAIGPAGPYLAEDVMPMILASVDISPIEMLTLTPSGFYQMYDLTEILPNTGGDVDVDAWGVALDGRVSFEMFRISFEGWYGQNLGLPAAIFDGRVTMGRPVTIPMGVPTPDATFMDIEDVDAYGGFIQISVPLEVAILNIGGGYQQSDVEVPGPGWEDDISSASYFINVLYNLTDNFYVQPEVGYFDYGDDAFEWAAGNDLGSDIYVGVHFQADF